MRRTAATQWVTFGLALALSASLAEAATIKVTISKLTFEPATVEAKVGDTIEWVNQDFVAHTATAGGKEWDVVIQKDQTGRTTVTKAGTVDYFCRFHPNMKGKIVVRE